MTELANEREAALAAARRAVNRIDVVGDLVDIDEYGQAAAELRRLADALDEVERVIAPEREAQRIAEAVLRAADL